MRRPSAIDLKKQEERVEHARRMTPEERLLACANISRAVLELQLAGRRDRAKKPKPGS